MSDKYDFFMLFSKISIERNPLRGLRYEGLFFTTERKPLRGLRYEGLFFTTERKPLRGYL